MSNSIIDGLPVGAKFYSVTETYIFGGKEVLERIENGAVYVRAPEVKIPLAAFMESEEIGVVSYE